MTFFISTLILAALIVMGVTLVRSGHKIDRLVQEALEEMVL